MLELIKHLFPFFMSDKPPNIHSLFPRTNDDINIFYWCSRILGLDVGIANHCKADRAPKHEFLKAYLTLYWNGKKYDIHIIIHRTPAPDVEIDPDAPKPQRTSTTSLASPQSTISSQSPSPSFRLSEHILGILKKGHPVPANDRVIISKTGQVKDFDDACTKSFGSYITLNSLFIREEHTPMSAPQLATVLEVAHNLAPNYSLKKYQCYWKQTNGDESNECIKTLGKLWWMALTHSADDDENVVQDEYDKAWAQFQKSEDERQRNPEEACRLTQERASSFEREAEEERRHAGRREEEERKHADEAGRREEEERKHADEAGRREEDERKRTEDERKHADEAGRREEEAKQNEKTVRMNAVEEKRRRLQVEMELRELRERIETLGKA
ncbi:hypothetical protein PILCRDRAFT_91753 [Piloderma croceum F 1598]|uniref:Uncharacterized protein n=1 Tax=Piloderma croceum (strain F 1598) TaxID=765440 RepID=A0A0C3F8G3_PILCF|nr:hypothetical protein PILCRDRAFT_91753 [Piloderma croceum F 1598]